MPDDDGAHLDPLLDVGVVGKPARPCAPDQKFLTAKAALDN
jgi:hypothetical protein